LVSFLKEKKKHERDPSLLKISEKSVKKSFHSQYIIYRLPQQVLERNLAKNRERLFTF